MADANKRRSLGNAAYSTILSTWNAKVAAERIIKFIEDETHKIPEYESGPMSRA